MGSEDLDRAIQHAVALVGLIPKEDRYRPVESISTGNRQIAAHVETVQPYSRGRSHTSGGYIWKVFPREHAGNT